MKRTNRAETFLVKSFEFLALKLRQKLWKNFKKKLKISETNKELCRPSLKISHKMSLNVLKNLKTRLNVLGQRIQFVRFLFHSAGPFGRTLACFLCFSSSSSSYSLLHRNENFIHISLGGRPFLLFSNLLPVTRSMPDMPVTLSISSVIKCTHTHRYTHTCIFKGEPLSGTGLGLGCWLHLFKSRLQAICRIK